MSNLFKKHRVIMLFILIIIVIFGFSTFVYADDPPNIDSGKDALTETHFHLSTDNVLRLNDDGQVNQDSCSITGNLMTFTHPNTPNTAAIGDWYYVNQVGMLGRDSISGSFSVNVGWEGFPPGFIYGPVYGKILITFDAKSIYVPKIDENWEPDHYNFQGTFKIIGGEGFYEGISGTGTIGGTFHDHEWDENAPDSKWFDFVMIGQARFPG